MAKITNGQTVDCIEKQEEFETRTGSMRGVIYKSGIEGRHLNRIGRGNSFTPEEVFTYVVYSYATPIAAVSVDQKPFVPAEKFSVTTSQHQSYCRSGMRNM